MSSRMDSCTSRGAARLRRGSARRAPRGREAILAAADGRTREGAAAAAAAVSTRIAAAWRHARGSGEARYPARILGDQPIELWA